MLGNYLKKHRRIQTASQDNQFVFNYLRGKREDEIGKNWPLPRPIAYCFQQHARQSGKRIDFSKRHFSSQLLVIPGYGRSPKFSVSGNQCESSAKSFCCGRCFSLLLPVAYCLWPALLLPAEGPGAPWIPYNL